MRGLAKYFKEVDNADTRLAVGTPAICNSLWRLDAAMNFAIYTKCVIGSIEFQQRDAGQIAIDFLKS